MIYCERPFYQLNTSRQFILLLRCAIYSFCFCNILAEIANIIKIFTFMEFTFEYLLYRTRVVVLAGLIIRRRDTIDVNERLCAGIFNIVNRMRWYIADLAAANI